MVIKGRKRIGILLVSPDIGVIYYLLSIVESLSFLDDPDKPEIILFYSDKCEKYLELFKYEHLSQNKIDYRNIKLKHISGIFLRRNLIIQPILDQYSLDGLFPVMDLTGRLKKGNCTIASWIPDFQHKFYPEFFTRRNLVMREARFKQILYGCDTVVLSSNDAYSHLKKFYKINGNKPNVQVMPFVSMIRDFKITDFDTLKKKYKISTPFFLVSNQFYAHKNHLAVLEAIREQIKVNPDFTVFLTGKTEDYRNPLFFKTLTDFIENNNLQKQAVILGLIPREDQLGLLKHSLSVIQPSKFEGWSTIIEDAKTLQKPVICSSINVHKEQLGDKGFYFDINNAHELAVLMHDFLTIDKYATLFFNNYDERVKAFASGFVEIF